MKTDSERMLCGMEAASNAQVSLSERLLQRTPRERGPLGSLPLELAEDTFLLLGISQSGFFATEDLGYSDTGEGLCRGLY